MPDKTLRNHLVDMLTKENAHLVFEDAVNDFPEEHYGTRIDGQPHTAWQQLEHLRIAQWDILEFSRNPKHKSPSWPEGYWPDADGPDDANAWSHSVSNFQADLQQFCDLVRDDDNDLYEPFAHGDGQTLLREALVLAKHNSYHIGQLVLLKKLLAGRS